MKKYSKVDLYRLWLQFRENDDADTILSDFMVATKVEARQLIEEFEIQYTASTLGLSDRGNENRQRKNI